MRLLAVLLTLAVTFAGCSDAPESPETDDPFVGVPEATDDTGIIRGVVVDPAIVPIEGASVTLVGTGQITTSDADGLFYFADLAPATYFMEVARLGFRPAQASATVEAGVDRPEIIKVLLEPDAGGLPFVEAFQIDGFLECTTPQIALCAVPNTAVEIVNLLGGAAGNDPELDPVTANSFIFDIELTPDPSWVQTEMAWEATQAAGDSLKLVYSYYSDADIAWLNYASDTGPSPLMVYADQAAIDERGLGAGNNLTIRVFGAGLEETDGLVGATLQQKYSLFNHVFHNLTPVEGWRFTVDGEPEVPE